MVLLKPLFNQTLSKYNRTTEFKSKTNFIFKQTPGKTSTQTKHLSDESCENPVTEGGLGHHGRCTAYEEYTYVTNVRESNFLR
jgi:hypothetical protein